MIERFVIYEQLPFDRTAKNAFYGMETRDGDGNTIRRFGRSAYELGVNSDDIESGDEAVVTTIAAVQINLKRGHRLKPVSVEDLAAFRRGYLGRGSTKLTKQDDCDKE